MGHEPTHHDLKRMAQRPEGLVSIHEVLAYLESDRYMNKREAAAYLSLSVRLLETRLDEIPHFRVGQKILFKKSELDQWMELHREGGNHDLDRIADEAMKSLSR